MQHLIKMHPELSEDAILAIKTKLENGHSLTKEEEAMVQQCRSRMGREGNSAAVAVYLKKMYPELSEDAILAIKTKLENGHSLTKEEDAMVQQCRSQMGCEGGRAGAPRHWFRKWRPDITDDQIRHILENDLWDSISSWTQRYVSDCFVADNF
jgi:hypothetical protein